MKLIEINPFIRFATKITYHGDNTPVIARDCRIFYLLSGTLNINIDDENYVLEKNALFYCSAGGEYSVLSQQSVELLVINFDLNQENSHKKKPLSPLLKERYKKEKILTTPKIIDSDILNGHIFLKDVDVFYPSIKEITKEFDKKKSFYNEKSSALLKSLLIEIHREKIVEATPVSQLVMEVSSYIDENYFSDLTNQQIASIYGYHPYHLNKLFVEQTGISIHKYLIKTRLAKAQRLMSNTNLSIQEISDKVGFSVPSTFTVAFKKEYGITPLAYKKKVPDYI